MYVELSNKVIELAKHLRGYESGSSGQSPMVWLLANAVVEASERAEHDDDRGAFVDDDYIDPPQSLVDNLATRAHHSTAPDHSGYYHPIGCNCGQCDAE
jgi:hypothetical protein